MIFIVNRETNNILARFEAWALNAYETAVSEAHNLGSIIGEEITLNGDMVIWVK